MRSSRWSSLGRSALSAGALPALLFAVYTLTLGTHAQPGSRLTAAEAHVLLTAASIADDGDLDLRNQHDEEAWRPFYRGDLHPTARPDLAGRILEPQGAGLPLALAPAYALGGVTLVRLLLAALAAIAIACGAALARRVVPDPWTSFAALGIGLSPPMVAAATTIRPEIPAAAALAGAAVLALRIRDDPQAAPAFWAALLLAIIPWIALPAILPAVVIAMAMTRWLRRRRRGLAGFVALEVILTSLVVFITVNDNLFGGRTPYASGLREGPATRIDGAGDVLSRLRHIAELAGELLRWAPMTLLVLAGAWLLLAAHRERLAAIAPDHVHVEVVAAFAALLLAAQLGAGGLLAPHIHGDWFPTRYLVPVLPFAVALAAWGLRRYRRTGAALIAVTLGLTAWMLIAALAGDATLAPPDGFGWAV
ncbi:MAG: hypothetical protein ACJ762_08125 [Solirubrobacteraceae bacterium]